MFMMRCRIYFPAAIRGMTTFLRVSWLWFFVLSLTFVSVRARKTAEPDTGNFSSALAELRTARAQMGQMVSLSAVIERNEAFFRRVDLSVLTPEEIAGIVRLNAFAYGEVGPALAKATLARLAPLAEKPDDEGALATVICSQLTAPAGADGKERQAWRTRALRHSGLDALLQSEWGDLALETAMSAGGEGEDRERILGLAEKLDASKSTAAATAVEYYWKRRVEKLPKGERRESIRRRLVGFLTVALEKEKETSTPQDRLTRIESSLAFLNGIDARGELLGEIAPELNFVWSTRDEWKSLKDLRGKVVVLDFWATWCGSCVASFPEVARLTEHYRGFDVEVVGVTSLEGSIAGLKGKPAIDCRGDPDKELRLLGEYVRERAFSWPIVVSKENVMNPDYGIDGVPTVIVIAPDGTVRFKSSGFSKAKVTEQIDGLLAEFKRPVPARQSQPATTP